MPQSFEFFQLIGECPAAFRRHTHGNAKYAQGGQLVLFQMKRSEYLTTARRFRERRLQSERTDA
jgi:hypothetical protein